MESFLPLQLVSGTACPETGLTPPMRTTTRPAHVSGPYRRLSSKWAFSTHVQCFLGLRHVVQPPYGARCNTLALLVGTCSPTKTNNTQKHCHLRALRNLGSLHSTFLLTTKERLSAKTLECRGGKSALKVSRAPKDAQKNCCLDLQRSFSLNFGSGSRLDFLQNNQKT